MQYISIGRVCNVKAQIDKNKGKKETLFFDWLLTDMPTVIHILKNHNEIDTILNINTITRDPNKLYFHNNSRIIINSLPLCVCVHDLKKNEFKEANILNLIDKYKRRIDRIIEFIKSQTKICFIRNSPVTDDEKKLFIETVLTINPNCNFTLVIIDTTKGINSIIKEDHCLYINIIELPKTKKNDWTTNHFNWKKIFADIDSNI
jgi:hypothetical protein